MEVKLQTLDSGWQKFISGPYRCIAHFYGFAFSSTGFSLVPSILNIHPRNLWFSASLYSSTPTLP